MCKIMDRPVPGGGPQVPWDWQGRAVHTRVPTPSTRSRAHKPVCAGRKPQGWGPGAGRGSHAEGRQGNREQRTRRGGGN